MTPAQIDILALVPSVIAVFCAVYVAVRAGKWRETDDAKELIGRVGKVEQEVTQVKTRLESLATKSDLEGLKSEVRAIGREVGKVDDGVTRIESWLVERGVGK